MTSDLTKVLDVANQAASAGGHVLRRYWRDGVELRDKSLQGGKSYDLVSDADLESQSVIVNLLQDAFPNHAVMGEEDLAADVDAEHLWIVDPLDGTNNFVHHIPHFAVSIAYFRGGRPTVGVVLNPVTGDLYTATIGGGAFHNGHPIHTSKTDALSQSLVGCGFYYDRGHMMRSTLSAIQEFFVQDIHGIRRFGTAALDLCAVAAGMFGVFFEYKLSPWDFAAGQLIVTEAGGTVTDAKGEPLPIAQSSVLATAAALHSAALEITTRHHP